MPSVQINSSNINTFSFTASVDVMNRVVNFDTSSTIYNGSGLSNVLGICFSLVDSVGLELMGVNWSSPQIIPSSSQTYQLDLTSLPINFLFQNYQWIGYIKDQDGTVYSTLPILKNVCQPPNINESGYVPGMFQVLPDCINNVLTVKELTLLVYNNLTPLLTTKSGTLSYPTGTISPVTFTGTPFSNNVIYTGQYLIVCTTVSTYDLEDGIFVMISYVTNQNFDVTCGNYIGDITCCISKVYDTYINNCENAKGQYALQQYNATLLPFSLALAKQINGQDASSEVSQIRKMLNCDCGSSSIGQNEITPTNPSVNSIVLQGVGGTNIPSPTIIGNTKTYQIASNSYVVGKGNTGDLAFTITTDTSISNVVTYKITFNYGVMAGYILNAIAADPTLINQLNSLITGSGGSIIGLDGKCVIDLTKSDYSVSQSVDGTTQISNIVINGTTYNSPSVYANNATAVAAWLNSLTLGTFTAVVNSGTLTIQSVSNPNNIATITFTSPNITKQFSATNATLVQVLQAVINYLCNMTALQVALVNNLNLCTFDYNGNIITTTFVAGSSQSNYNAGVASAICNIVSRMNNITAVTCATLQAIFVDRPTVSFQSNDRIYGTLGGNCAGLTDQQLANVVLAAVNKYSDVKTAFCGISCTAPGTCPDITNSSLAMSGSSIGVYGVTWSSIQSASQTVTVKYRVTGTLTYFVATNSLVVLPNGNLSGTSPFLISGLAVGTTYDVYIQNNCGGSGFTKQITTPTGSVYSGSYLLENTIYAICGASPVTLYSSQPFGSGTIMYTDIGLSVPVTGYTYITIAGSNIFQLNTSTGVVGINTGSSCSTGTLYYVKLGNDTSTICSASTSSIYTNGTFGVGKVMYTDVALTNPLTGYSYVVFGNTIYSVNYGTGSITGVTGLSCSTEFSLMVENDTPGIIVTGISLAGNPVLVSGVPINDGGASNGFLPPTSGVLSVTISGTPTSGMACAALSVNGTFLGGKDISSGAGTYSFTSRSYLGGQSVQVEIADGTCPS